MLKPVCSICLAVQRRKITPKPRKILRGRGRGTGQANIPHRLATTKAAFATRRALAAAIIILSPLLVHSVRGASNNRRSAAFTLPALGLQVGKTATSARRLAALNNPAALEIMSFQKVFDKDLFVSEPNPAWFGNPPNEPNPAWTNANWLKSRFHFSFAEYNNAKNSNFGVLRVTNDDLVQPSRGFGAHPHREMEIVTYIVEGELSHQDSMGTEETLGRGSVQFMTAGTGIRHSEHNRHPRNPLRFIQMWILPAARGLTPNYGSMEGSKMAAARKNGWAHMVSNVKDSSSKTPVEINQDCNMYVTELDQAKTLDLELGAGRQAYVLCMEGSVSVSGPHGETKLDRHDAAEAVGPSKMTFTGADAEAAHVLVVEMKGNGEGSRFG